MTFTGELALWAAAVFAAWSAGVAVAGGMLHGPSLLESARRGIHAVAVLLAVGLLALWSALLRSDFSLRYVAAHWSRNLPAIHTASAAWGGRAGALLFAGVAFAACAWVAQPRRDRAAPRHAAAAVAAHGTLLLLILVLILIADPFDRLSWIPPDGMGLHPRLHTAAALLNPPLLFSWLAALSVPFVLTIAAAVGEQLDVDWLQRIRQWTLGAWLLGTASIVSGTWWLHGEGLGSGALLFGVNTASLLPWLAGSALLVSTAVLARRGSVPHAIAVLPIVAFLLAAVSIAASLGRLPLPAGEGSAPVLWASGLAAISIVATAVLLRRRAGRVLFPAISGRVPRRRSGALLIAAAAAALTATFAGVTCASSYRIGAAAGQTVELPDPLGRTWVLANEGISRFDLPDRRVIAATVAAYRDDRRVALISAERRQYVDSRGAPNRDVTARPVLLGSLAQDVVVTLDAVTDETAFLQVRFIPMIRLLWVGGLCLAAGGALLFWPQSPPAEAGERRRPDSSADGTVSAT